MNAAAFQAAEKARPDFKRPRSTPLACRVRSIVDRANWQVISNRYWKFVAEKNYLTARYKPLIIRSAEQGRFGFKRRKLWSVVHF